MEKEQSSTVARAENEETRESSTVARAEIKERIEQHCSENRRRRKESAML